MASTKAACIMLLALVVSAALCDGRPALGGGPMRRLVQASPAPASASTCTLTNCPCSLTKPEMDMTCCAPKSCAEPCNEYFWYSGNSTTNPVLKCRTQ